MSKKGQDYIKLIERQRSEKKKEKFSGTFLEYLDIVSGDSAVTRLAHKRLYQSIVDKGVEIIDESDNRKQKIFDGEDLKIYDYFKDHFFGMESVIDRVMNYLKSAAFRGEESRQVLLLMGPVGAGKSAVLLERNLFI
jgi:serine protein kinase